MPEAELLAIGEGDYRLHAPDVLRVWMRDRKRRDLVDKTTIAADAVGRLLADRDDVSSGSSSFTCRAQVIGRDMIRERRRNLWYRAKSPLMESTLFVATGARSNPPRAHELEIRRDHIDPGRTVIGRTVKS